MAAMSTILPTLTQAGYEIYVSILAAGVLTYALGLLALEIDNILGW